MTEVKATIVNALKSSNAPHTFVYANRRLHDPMTAVVHASDCDAVLAEMEAEGAIEISMQKSFGYNEAVMCVKLA